MKTTIKNITIKIFTFLMIGLIGILIVNKAVFLHVHKLSDGTIIVHAHPYDKSTDSEPFKSHHHSSAGFFFFQNINILFLVLFSAFAFVFFGKKEQFLFEFKVSYYSTCVSLKKGRAPPIS